MSEAVKRKRNKHAEFWRATGFLQPYRHLVVISTVCAFIVGIIGTVGLTAIVPILRVLIENDTIPHWVDRQLVETRLGVTLGTDDVKELHINRLKNGEAKESKIRRHDVLTAPPGVKEDDILTRLADPAVTSGAVLVDHRRLISLDMAPLNRWQAIGRRTAYLLPPDPVKAVAWLLGIVVLLAILANSVRYFQEHLSDKAAILAVNDIRRKTYDHALHIPLSFFGTEGTSDVTSRLVQDAQGLQDGFKIILGQTIQEPIRAAMAFGLALYVDWRLTAFIVLFAPLMVTIIRKFGKKVRRATRAALQNSASMLGQIEGTLAGIRVVKAAGSERFERRRYNGIMGELVEQQLKMSRYEALSTPTMETLTLIVVSCVVLFAVYLVCKQQTLKPSSFLLLMAALMTIGESLRKVSKLNAVLNRSNAAAARLFETLDVPVERPRELTKATTAAETHLSVLPPLSRDIRFENVSFAYPGAQHLALDRVSLSVPKGQSVAVVGRNGSGKTTLLALLPRFYDPQAGKILIDGHDIRGVTLNSLRRQIALVTQDSVIFPGTIADNIAYGLPLIPRDQIIHAAKRAFAHDFIMEKPAGYDTPLEGLGGQLSGGQKQRLCIARAILRNAPILVLDEATSQVDAESEHLIQQAIESLMHERTTFVIAHRFSTILSADTIVVIDKGRVVGQGRHKELLATCSTYKQLYERQLFSGPPSETA
jgi:ATP-binding cassette, subfamily B, bacterial MsbA